MVPAMPTRYLTKGWVVSLDPSARQDQILRCYCGSARFAHNWVIDQVKTNIRVRCLEVEYGVPETARTGPLSWTQYSMTPLWTSVRDEVAPWHRDVSHHAFVSRVVSATT